MMIYTLPFISAIIGWFTNFLAIKMLFHPRKPINLGFVKVQGIFPKRQQKLAEQVGEVVEEELFSVKDVVAKIKNQDNMDEVLQLIDERAEIYLKERLLASMPMLQMFVNDELIAKVKTSMVAEFELMLPEMIDKFAGRLENEVNIKEMVYDKIANFSSDKLEELLFSIMQKEFKFIEVVGAVLGFLIGLIQVGLLYFVK